MHFRPFEIVLIVIFVVGAIGGLIALSKFSGDLDEQGKVYGESVLVWGTVDESRVYEHFKAISGADPAFGVVSYVEKNPQTFGSDLLNAIADGTAPDLVILPDDMLYTFKSKLMPIPEEWMPERTFKDRFIDGGEFFRQSDGTYALPYLIDPLVLYYNKDLLSSAGLATPPKTWEVFVNDTVPRLTQYGQNRSLTQSAIGMGMFDNVQNAQEILSMLLFQAGNAIVTEEGSRYRVTLAAPRQNGPPSGQSALAFFMQFSNPGVRTYTWNRAQPSDREAFIGGKLAMYFGFGSELASLLEANPNMNFDIAPVPQAEGVSVHRNYGTYYGLAIPRAAAHPTEAFTVALRLLDPGTLEDLAVSTGLTPSLRALYGTEGQALYQTVLRTSSLISRTWLDPNPRESRKIFGAMINEVGNGQTEVIEAVEDASYNLGSLFK